MGTMSCLFRRVMMSRGIKEAGAPYWVSQSVLALREAAGAPISTAHAQIAAMVGHTGPPAPRAM